VRPVIHIAARRYGEIQRCRRCGDLLHRCWQTSRGRWSAFHMGHRVLAQDTPNGRSLTDIDRPIAGGRIVKAIDQAVPCRRGAR
jgi:hypothetical protein